MAKQDIEALLLEIRQLRDGPSTPEARRRFQQILSRGPSLAVARVASIIAASGQRDLEKHLVPAFDRFCQNPLKSDKGCQGKQAIARALLELESAQGGLFMTGVRHIQMEPAFGKPVDTAAGLRGLCAMGLITMSHPAAFDEAADLLADRDPEAREGAARALGHSGDDRAASVLRLKIRAGDEEERVLDACYRALFSVSWSSGVDLAARQLESPDDEVACRAAFALGESRRLEAIEPLQNAFVTSRSRQVRAAAAGSVAWIPGDEAFNWLVERVRSEPGPVARELLTAVATQLVDEGRRSELVRIARRREDADLTSALVAFEDREHVP